MKTVMLLNVLPSTWLCSAHLQSPSQPLTSVYKARVPILLTSVPCLCWNGLKLEGVVGIAWHMVHCRLQETIPANEIQQFHVESTFFPRRWVFSFPGLTYKYVCTLFCPSHALTFWFVCFCRIRWWLRYHLSAIRELPALFRSTFMSATEREREASTSFSPIFQLMVTKYVSYLC